MKVSSTIIESILKEFFREKYFYEDAKDNRSEVIAKTLGLHYQTINTVLKNHFLHDKHNAPIETNVERTCDCYRDIETCFCEIRLIK